MVEVFCGNQKCGLRLDEPSNLPTDDRQPCPRCGALHRHFKVTITSKIRFYSALGIKARRPGRKKPFIEAFTGHELFRKTGRWMRKLRVIDRENDYYKEEVRDLETDQLQHFQEEPLSQHWGHGSARHKK